jgi:hypothetical protein
VASSGSAADIRDRIYRDPYKDAEGKTASKVIDYLNKWYLYKCAYCERFYKMDVEHYRPKGEVRDENNNIVEIQIAGRLAPHPGYYWLGYEWSNLIPSCISCNREGGKGSKFPVLGQHTWRVPINAGALEFDRCSVGHSDLTTERPYLLHPEYDELEGMFSFEVAEGKKGILIKGSDILRRGQMTIEICQMNRMEIRIDRQKTVIEPIRKTFIALLMQLSRKQKSLNEIRREATTVFQKLDADATDISLNHTYLRRYIVQNVQNFETIVLPFIPQRMQEIVLTAFRSFKSLP